MAEPASIRMTADEFIAWAMRRPEGEHYELADGEVIAMAPERAEHVDAKGHLYRRLMEAVERGSLDYRAGRTSSGNVLVSARTRRAAHTASEDA